MKWLRWALLGALALAACGRDRGGGGQGSLAARQPSGDPAPHPMPVSTPASSPGDCPGGVRVRIIGTHPGDVKSLVLTPGLVGATCAFSPACSSSGPRSAPIDLSTDATAWDLVTFNYPPPGFPPPGFPPGAGTPERGLMTLGVDFTAGSARAGDRSGELSVCGSALHFTFDPTRIDPERCAVTILLDVGRSVVPSGGSLLFVPQYRVYF